jgi:hypothetical protein
MVEWVENGREIDVLVATKYVNDTEGIAFTRKLCPVSIVLFSHVVALIMFDTPGTVSATSGVLGRRREFGNVVRMPMMGI